MKHYLIKALAKKTKFFSKQPESSDDSDGSLSSDDEEEVSKETVSVDVPKLKNILYRCQIMIYINVL